jgi:hypothetical protein
MHSTFLRSLLLCGFLGLGSAANAAFIFNDTFSANVPSLNSPVPLGWTINNGGSVDIIGTCSSIELNDWLPGNTCYIDLDGGTGVNGLLTKNLDLAIGHTYTAYFDLAGNQNYPFVDTVKTDFGGVQQEFEIQPFDDFATYHLSFTPVVAGTYSLSFVNSNIDDYGALVDNVRVLQVPGPLPVVGVATMLGVSRRLRARLRLRSQRR